MYIILQDLKLSNQLFNKHGENLDEKSLTICSGTDYINISYQHVVCPDAATAKVSKVFFNHFDHNQLSKIIKSKYLFK